MVELTIKNIDKTVNFKKATASRGKAIRAEPVVALYEQGLVHHVGEFVELEDQLCTWSPEDSTWSPDRLDALVWSISYLAGFNGLNERMRFIPGYGLQPY
jgi:phage terminase large subunit-like protein